MGDGLMAVFETDTSAASARAGLEAVTGIGQALQRFNTTLSNEGSLPVAIGIGLHLGNVVLGEIGAAGQAPRTLIGDTVNTASRLESETKPLGVEALVSIETLEAAQVSAPQGALVALNLRGREMELRAMPLKKATEAAQLKSMETAPTATSGISVADSARL